MFQKLLKIIQEGRLHSLAEIASEMGISITMAEDLICELEKRKFLQAVSVDCHTQNNSCNQCPAAPQCKVLIKKWMLTKKGERLSLSR